MRVTKNVYIFHLHENFRLILRIWEKKWHEIILSFPKNAQMPHQIEYWKIPTHFGASGDQAVSFSRFISNFLPRIFGGAWHKRKYNEHDFCAFDFGTKMILCTNFRCSSRRKFSSKLDIWPKAFIKSSLAWDEQIHEWKCIFEKRNSQ